MKNQTGNILSYETLSFADEDVCSLILNNLDELFLLISQDLKIISLNETTRNKIFRYFGKEINSQTSILELAPKQRHKDLLKIYEAVFKGEEKTTETIIETNGCRIYFENHFKPAKNSKGEIVAALVVTRDVTNHKKAEASLKEIEERWRFALDGSNQGVWDWNIANGEVFYSDSYKRLYGFEENELKARIEEWESRIHPEDRKKMDKAVEEHVSSEDPYYESTYRIKAKDGSYKWVLARGMLIDKDGNGQPLRMIGTHTDITKQVAAEQTYKLLFYSNPLPMWTFDVDTFRFLSINDAAIKHYGYSKKEFLSMTIMDIKPKEDETTFLKRIEETKTASRKYLSRHIKKDGGIIYVEISAHTVEDSASNTMLVVAQDITAKLKSEEDLKKSNERFVLASRATSDAIYDWDLVTDELHWGEGLQKLFGFHPKEVPVLSWEKQLHPNDKTRVCNSLHNALYYSQDEFWKEEYRFAKADGSFRHVLDRGFIMRDQDQKPVRMIGSMQDITERKYSEQILSLERSVFEMSNNSNADLKQLVEHLLNGIEEIHENAFTSLLILKEDETIEPFVAPRLPGDFSKLLKGLKIGPNNGSCGAAMSRKETVIVADIDTDPLWKNYKALAQQFHLKACWSLPIIHSSGTVMGSFAIYYKKIKHPTKDELNTIERIRNILRILMEHHWSLNEIKKANERFDTVLKATHDLIWDWDLETNIIHRDERGLQKVYGLNDNKSIESIENWIHHIHADDVERVQKIITNILQAKEDNLFDVEYRFQRNDGSYSYVYDRGMILRNKNGIPVRIIGAAQNITERKFLEQELLRNELEKQKAINQATVDSQEQERTEIGKELHDNVNQILTTTKLYLELALSNPELKDDLIEKSNKNIIAVINEIRQLSRSLMDPTIGDLGLIDSVNDLIENINLTQKLFVSLKAERQLEQFLEKKHKLTIFRIIQEALNNTIKYAHAATVEISFRLIKNNVEVIIKDNGIGFNPSHVKLGAGLKNIQNRVYLINGTYTIQTAPEQGCTIIINFPITKQTYSE